MLSFQIRSELCPKVIKFGRPHTFKSVRASHELCSHINNADSLDRAFSKAVLISLLSHGIDTLTSERMTGMTIGCFINLISSKTKTLIRIERVDTCRNLRQRYGLDTREGGQEVRDLFDSLLLDCTFRNWIIKDQQI
jgi:hypothetical protein